MAKKEIENVSLEDTLKEIQKMFGKGSNVAVGSSGNTVDVVYNF